MVPWSLCLMWCSSTGADSALGGARFRDVSAAEEGALDEAALAAAAGMSEAARNALGATIVSLAVHELFVWRFMQTDPNWSNFLFDAKTNTLNLLDFGPCFLFFRFVFVNLPPLSISSCFLFPCRRIA
jgi:hypothetical protein